MQVKDVMTPEVRLASPEDSIQDAAREMVKHDIGVLPVGESNRLVGLLTDRDIVARAVAAGCNPATTRVRAVMSPEVRYCLEDDDVEDAAELMADLKVRRLPVLDREHRLVGLLSVSDISSATRTAGEAMKGITRPGGPHSQSPGGVP